MLRYLGLDCYNATEGSFFSSENMGRSNRRALNSRSWVNGSVALSRVGLGRMGS